MPVVKYKLREMSLKIVQNKQEFDSILSDRQGTGDKKDREKGQKQVEEDKIIPRYGHITTSELIPKTIQAQEQSSSITTNHGYIRTVIPNAAYSFKSDTIIIKKQLIYTLKSKNYTLLKQPQVISVVKKEILNYLTTKFKSNQLLAARQISLCGLFNGSYQYFPETVRVQVRNMIGDIYQDWKIQTSQVENFIDKTVHAKNKSFTSMSDFQRPFKPRLKARFNFELNFLQTTGINQNNHSTTNLTDIYHNIKQELQKEKLQSQSFQNSLFSLRKKLGFEISSQSLNDLFGQCDHSISLNEEISIGSNKLEQKKKRKVKKIKCKRRHRYHYKKEKKKVRIFYQMKQASKGQIKISHGSLKDSGNPRPKDKIKIPQQHPRFQDYLKSGKQQPKQEKDRKLKDVLDNLSQVIIPKENIFSYLNVGYKHKTKTDNNVSNTKKKVIKIENHSFPQKHMTIKANNTKRDQYNSSYSTCYQLSKDFSIYDSQQDET